MSVLCPQSPSYCTCIDCAMSGASFNKIDHRQSTAPFVILTSDRLDTHRMSSYDSRRNTNRIQRGNPASGSDNQDRRQNTGTRNQRRAYNFQQQKIAKTDWSEAREFEERPPKPRGPTQRSVSWRDKQQEKKKNKQEKKDDASAAYDFKAVQETAPVDEPLYDLGPHCSSIPVQENYSQNFEFSGYIDQVERSYETMRGIDPRLDRRLPFSMFQHSM
ncbi:unnamed protein product, partial [Iphiclides podalirius]